MNPNLVFSFFLLLLLPSCFSHKEETGKKDQAQLKAEEQYFPPDNLHAAFDTILDERSGLRFTIRPFARQDSEVIQEYSEDAGTKIIAHYQDAGFVAELSRPDALIFKKEIKKEDFKVGTDEEFYRQALLHGLWFEHYDHTTGSVHLTCSISVPETDWSNFYKIEITRAGEIVKTLMPEEEEI